MEDTLLYAGMLPTLEMYESIDRLQKPVIASVNGFAVGGGNVLQMVCDMTIAKESAVFRQVGPMMGSFDAGYGTWYLEDLVGKKRAKEMWYRNPKLTAKQALDWGLINHVVPDAELQDATRGLALEVAERGAFALASVKAAFNARHGGVGGSRPHGARSAPERVPENRGARRVGQSVRGAPQPRRVAIRPLNSSHPGTKSCRISSRCTIR